MHKRLEDYLGAVAKSLGALPKVRREEELREMQEHLLNAFVMNVEAGQSEEEAARAAVEQFGAAQTVGKGIVIAWRRARAREQRSFWAAFAYAFLFSCSLIIAQDFGYPACINHFHLMHIDSLGRAHFSRWLILIGWSWALASNIAIGGFAGLIFARYSTKAWLMGMLVGIIASQTLDLCLLYWSASRNGHIKVGPMNYLDDAFPIVIATLSAWAVSRRRLGRQVQGQ